MPVVKVPDVPTLPLACLLGNALSLVQSVAFVDDQVICHTPAFGTVTKRLALMEAVGTGTEV